MFHKLQKLKNFASLRKALQLSGQINHIVMKMYSQQLRPPDISYRSAIDTCQLLHRAVVLLSRYQDKSYLIRTGMQLVVAIEQMT